jgi:O-antigen/teichoic acid export membrane protein
MSKIQKRVAESSSFNLLTVYLTFIFSIMNTFVLARLLAPEEWALIILTLLFIKVAIFFTNLFPPNAQESIQYYIPYLTSKGHQYGAKRNFISHVYKIRLLNGFFISLLYLVIISLSFLNIILFTIIIIMSPMIICKVLIDLNDSVLFAYHKFKLVFITRILSPITITTFNFLIYFFQLEDPIFLIAYAYLLGTVISSSLSIILILKLIFTENNKEKLSLSYKSSDYYEIHKKYGIYLIVADLSGLISGLIINLLFLEFEFIIFITYITICQISATSALMFSSSNPESYISIFSEINYEDNPKTYQTLFYELNNFLMIFVCIIVAIMFFYIEFYIVVIYSTRYFVILGAIRLFLFTAFAQVIINNLMILTLSTNNTKINAEYGIVKMIIDISLTIIALIFFDFYTLIIFYLIGSFLMTFVMVILINKQTELQFRFTIFFKPLIIFLISFLIIFPLNYIINISYFDKAYINFFINGTIKFGVFAIVFYLIFYYTKLITKEEFRKMIEIIPILNSNNILIKWIVRKIEFFLPSK